MAICAVAEAAQPCSVRHVYYLGIGSLWDKDTGHSRRNYSVVVREVGHLRETGRLPWEWITDGTRMVRQETQYDSLDDAMQRNTETYRRNLWAWSRAWRDCFPEEFRGLPGRATGGVARPGVQRSASASDHTGLSK